MATTYTNNYSLAEPGYTDEADIQVLNANTVAIDNLIHQNRLMIADVYDSTKTYEVGDVVIQEGVLYKCVTAVETAESFDSDKWEVTTAVKNGAGGGSGDTVKVTQTLTEGTEIGKILVNSEETTLYAPKSESSTAVTITPTLTEGTKIADYSIGETGGELYAPSTSGTTEKTSVTVTPALTEGTKIADIDVDGETKTLYAPKKTEVTVTPALEEGEKVADVDVDGTTKSIYVPKFSDIDIYSLYADGAGSHNSVYRGKNLGTAVTDEQWAVIKDGSFTDLYIGDYWVINSVNWRIAAFDYYYLTGDTPCTTHHVVIVPDSSLYSAQMNKTDITTGAYVGSVMYTTNLATAKTTITTAFGSDHILTHRQYLKNAVKNGYESGGAWLDSTVELMTEQSVYGGVIFENTSSGTAVPQAHTIDKSQYPLFAMNPYLISNRVPYWLRDVASTTHFAYVSDFGNPSIYAASNTRCVRPAFSIC